MNGHGRSYRRTDCATPRIDERWDRHEPQPQRSGARPRLNNFNRRFYDFQLSLTRYERHRHDHPVMSRIQIDDSVRRTNRTIASINASIIRISPNAQVHPMQTRHGNYPPAFATPRKLVDFLYIPAENLNEILRAYEIVVPEQRNSYGPKRVAWADEQSVEISTLWRAHGLFHLFQFLGAYRVAEEMREVVRERSGGGYRPGNERRVTC